MSSEHLRFSPDILKRLGEELVPQPDQGIIELVRNSYDADATACRLELRNVEELGGSITLSDNGQGMDRESIHNGWLVLGRSTKNERQVTSLGRLPVGQKGLGRLAALRMGSQTTLVTRPAGANIEYRLHIDWHQYDTAKVVEDVALEIEERPAQQGPGTVIELSDLSIKLGRRETQRLARSLILLADPFDDASGFHPELVSPSFKDLEDRVRNAYFGESEYRLIATLDENGLAHAKVLDSLGKVLWEGNHTDIAKSGKAAYNTASASFNLWVFILDSQKFSNRVASLTEVKEWLEVVGGVHLYHRGLRSHPYGDAGHDWIEMNLARVRSPELRPSTNTSIGRVVVPDPDGRLSEKTDRSGFIENEAFCELRLFVMDALEWMSDSRMRERENRRQRDRMDAPKKIEQARNSVAEAVKQVPEHNRPAIERAMLTLENARDQQAQSIREDLLLYRTLATVGTTIAVFAHEAAKPVGQIEKMAKSIESRAKKELGDRYEALLGKPVSVVVRSAHALQSFAALPLKMLKREKRRIGEVNVHGVIGDVLDLFEPFLTDAKVCARREFADDKAPVIWGSSAALESILSNLITNAVNAFNTQDATSEVRTLVIRTEVQDKRLILSVLDNGPGIKVLTMEEIWLPGRTTVPGGTGLGLTIVRDAVADLGGNAHAIARGQLGGAEVLVELPILGFRE